MSVCVSPEWRCVEIPHMQLRFQGQLKVTFQQQAGKRLEAQLNTQPANRNYRLHYRYRFCIHFPLEQLLDGVARKDL